MSNITPLHELAEGQEADFFALLADKQLLATRDGKPYHRVSFRDAQREVSFPIWGDSTHADVCRDEWQAGEFYKIRGLYRETTYGPQLDIHRIRPIEAADADDGFDPLMCSPRSRFEPEAMFDEMMQIADQAIADQALRDFTKGIYQQYRDELLLLPAAKVNHHAYLSGYLEHVLNVTRHTRLLVEQYVVLYDQMQPPINAGIAVAGAMLHDIGKLRELSTGPAGATYTAAGTLIGHILQGRDIVREAALAQEKDPENDSVLDPETLLRLEHLIVAHQRLPEWGSPKPPMTPEALIVHHADDLDAKLQMMVATISDTPGNGEFTSHRNPLRQAIFRGNIEEKPDASPTHP